MENEPGHFPPNEEEDFLPATGATVPACINCGLPLTTGRNFCGQCGVKQKDTDEGQSERKWQSTRQVLIFFVVYGVICCVYSFIHDFHTLTWSIITDATLALLSVIFFVSNWPQCSALLRWPNFSGKRLALYCLITVVSSLIIGMIVDWLNLHLFSARYSFYSFYEEYSYGKAMTIFFVAVMPAIFEEIGFRGFLLTKLLDITEPKQAIIISGFLFAIMHRTMLSLFWLIPFGIWQGYIRVKRDTIWYGVCIHFCFNFTACIIDIWQTAQHH